MPNKKKTLLIMAFTLGFAVLAMVSIVLFHEVFSFTSSNSALYLLRGQYGGIEIKRDLFIEEADRLIFMVDANKVFNYMMKGVAVARNKPVLELTWDENVGIGEVKQFRGDGSILSIPFSRFKDGANRPQGLFLGGDLPYGDTSRATDRDTSGMSFFDGEDWHHVWCATNEGFGILGDKSVYVFPIRWEFVGSKVLTNNEEKVILQSDHRLQVGDDRMLMKRMASFRAGDNYFVLKVKLINMGDKPLTYGYSWGDEPWVGHYFTGSKGDVGWSEDGLIKHEKMLSPIRNRYVGLWDYGNDAAGEKHEYSNIANFVEWTTPTPSYVFLSNSIEKCCDESVPLYSSQDRVVSLVWHNNLLLPGESRTYTLAIGMADIDPQTGMPVKPTTRID